MKLIDADAMHIDFDKYVEYIRRMRKGKIPKAEIAILLDCRDIIDNAPTVDAIPIEWILDYKDKYTVITSEECDPVKSEVIADMLAEWAERKEE